VFDTVNYAVANQIASIQLNRPERHNALSYDLVRDLDSAFDVAEGDPDVRVIVLSGAGKSFCSGWDRGHSPYLTPPDGGWKMGEAIDRLGDIEARYMRIWNCPKPTIAKVHGHAIAAGCYLQMLCDISVAADDATLGHPVSQGGATSMPPRQVLLGPKMARYLLFTGRTINGNRAEEIGLVSLAVPRTELDVAVDTLAMEIAEGDPASMRISKESWNVDLEMMGVGAMFRYHGQLNGLQRLRRP
jgi:enoyl-CoA hydratase